MRTTRLPGLRYLRYGKAVSCGLSFYLWLFEIGIPTVPHSPVMFPLQRLLFSLAEGSVAHGRPDAGLPLTVERTSLRAAPAPCPHAPRRPRARRSPGRAIRPLHAPSPQGPAGTLESVFVPSRGLPVRLDRIGFAHAGVS